jgi:hypothetical protein
MLGKWIEGLIFHNFTQKAFSHRLSKGDELLPNIFPLEGDRF